MSELELADLSQGRITRGHFASRGLRKPFIIYVPGRNTRPRDSGGTLVGEGLRA